MRSAIFHACSSGSSRLAEQVPCATFGISSLVPASLARSGRSRISGERRHVGTSASNHPFSILHHYATPHDPSDKRRNHPPDRSRSTTAPTLAMRTFTDRSSVTNRSSPNLAATCLCGGGEQTTMTITRGKPHTLRPRKAPGFLGTAALSTNAPSRSCDRQDSEPAKLSRSRVHPRWILRSRLLCRTISPRPCPLLTHQRRSKACHEPADKNKTQFYHRPP